MHETLCTQLSCYLLLLPLLICLCGVLSTGYSAQNGVYSNFTLLLSPLHTIYHTMYCLKLCIHGMLSTGECMEQSVLKFHAIYCSHLCIHGGTGMVCMKLIKSAWNWVYSNFMLSIAPTFAYMVCNLLVKNAWHLVYSIVMLSIAPTFTYTVCNQLERVQETEFTQISHYCSHLTYMVCYQLERVHKTECTQISCNYCSHFCIHCV